MDGTIELFAMTFHRSSSRHCCYVSQDY